MEPGRHSFSEEKPLFDNPLWDIKKAAAMLSVPEKTIRDWVYKRQMPFKKVGRHIRFCRSELERWIQSQGRSYAYQDH